MAKQKDTYYFPHDCNARNDNRIIAVRMKHGACGYGVYFMIVEKLRESADYKCVKDYNVIAFDLRVDTQVVKSVVEDFGLFAFADDGKCFYSESLTRRMAHLEEKREERSESARESARIRWDKEREMRTQCDCNANAMRNDANKSKVNKSKLKRDINISLKERPPDNGFDSFWGQYPKKAGKADAAKKFKAAIGKTTLAVMLDALEKHKQSRQWSEDGGKYIPNPSTWLHQERWADEVITVQQETRGQGNGRDRSGGGSQRSVRRADNYIAPTGDVFAGVTGQFDDVSGLPDPDEKT